MHCDVPVSLTKRCGTRLLLGAHNLLLIMYHLPLRWASSIALCTQLRYANTRYCLTCYLTACYLLLATYLPLATFYLLLTILLLALLATRQRRGTTRRTESTQCPSRSFPIANLAVGCRQTDLLASSASRRLPHTKHARYEHIPSASLDGRGTM